MENQLTVIPPLVEGGIIPGDLTPLCTFENDVLVSGEARNTVHRTFATSYPLAEPISWPFLRHSCLL